MTKWISVKHNIPKRLEKVIIYAPSLLKYGQDRFVACLCDWDDCYDWHLLSESFTHEVICMTPEEVTHWMPLPEPPEGE